MEHGEGIGPRAWLIAREHRGAGAEGLQVGRGQCGFKLVRGQKSFLRLTVATKSLR